MNRRGFLALFGAAAVAPMIPVPTTPHVHEWGAVDVGWTDYRGTFGSSQVIASAPYYGATDMPAVFTGFEALPANVALVDPPLWDALRADAVKMGLIAA